jgi:hypothetical protein
LLLLGFAALIAISSFGTWITTDYPSPFTFRPVPHAMMGTSSQVGGQGWVTLILALAAGLGAAIGFSRRLRSPYVIAGTLFGSVVVVAAVSVLELRRKYVDPVPPYGSIGWGLWLCLGSAAVALIYSCIELRRAEGVHRSMHPR